MYFYSTQNKNHRVSLREAVLHSLAPDNGLYMPQHIPILPPSFFSQAHSLSFAEIAYCVAKPFLENDIPENVIKKIIDETISFDAPLIALEENIFALELFHGPTLAFKDFGARFMARLVTYFTTKQERETIVLVATSGDTGSAVANGFYDCTGLRVIILYPSGKVSPLQEKQFTTLGKNITALEVDGTFDDCQRLVKQAFLDEDLNKLFFLTSANSINIARLIPQMFYYFYAWSRLANKKHVVFSVPSGNFGNLIAGLMAKKMGLPIRQFLASTNANDVVPIYLKSGGFEPRASVSTCSNAMDVGNPSNFVRMLDLYNNNWESIKNDVQGFAFSDEETKAAMQQVFNTSSYTLDPHGAIGYMGLKKYLTNNILCTGVFLETAHPAKFLEVVESTLEKKIEMPSTLVSFAGKEKKSIRCESDYKKFKTILVQFIK